MAVTVVRCLLLVLLVLVLLSIAAKEVAAKEPRRMPHKKPFSGKAKKEYLKNKKEDRKLSGRGAGFSSVVCDWGSTAVTEQQPSPGAQGEGLEKHEGTTWSGAQLLGHGAEACGRTSTKQAIGLDRGQRAKGRGGSSALLVQAPRNKLSTFFEREDDAAVQERKLDATRPCVPFPAVPSI